MVYKRGPRLIYVRNIGLLNFSVGSWNSETYVTKIPDYNQIYDVKLYRNTLLDPSLATFVSNDYQKCNFNLLSRAWGCKLSQITLFLMFTDLNDKY